MTSSEVVWHGMRGFLLSLGAVVLLAGCGKDGGRPEENFTLYPVKGRVVQANGRPLSGGVIRFLPIMHPSFVANSEIAEDGTFTLMTELPGKGVQAVVPDVEYTVAIVPPQPIPGRPLVPLAGTYKIAGTNNDLTIKVPNLQAMELPPPPR